KENWTGFIVVAAEHQQYPSAGLRVEGNIATLAPGETRSPAFLADYSHEHLAEGANRLGAGVRAFETR
ncbi:MAG: right-handed parallel beta-helix repeat-containing protein, partial [Sphingomonas sp.]